MGLTKTTTHTFSCQWLGKLDDTFIAAGSDVQPSEMHGLFNDGLAAFQQGLWPEAARIFQEALADDANDGPSRFYLQKALEYYEKPPIEWEGVVILDGK